MSAPVNPQPASASLPESPDRIETLGNGVAEALRRVEVVEGTLRALPDSAAKTAVLPLWIPRWLLRGLLFALVTFNLAIISYLGVEYWRAVSQPPPAVTLGPLVSIDAKEVFENYKERVDSLYKFVLALIGLATLYNLVVGVAGYNAAQFYEKRFSVEFANLKSQSDAQIEALKERSGTQKDKFTGELANLKAQSESQIDVLKDRSKSQLESLAAQNAEYKKKIEDLEMRYPSFERMDRSAKQMIENIEHFVPEFERMEDLAARLKPEEIERGLAYERTAAFFEFLGPQRGVEISQDRAEIYRRLSRFYQALHHRLDVNLDVDLLLDSPVAAASSAFPHLRKFLEARKEDLLERAAFYVKLSIDEDSKRFTSLNEYGRILYLKCEKELAKRTWDQSRRLKPKQQRALFGLACIEHDSANYHQAEALYTEALNGDVWEAAPPSKGIRGDICYNRACARSRIAAAADKAGDQSTRDHSLTNCISDLKESAAVTVAERPRDWLERLKDDLKSAADKTAGALPNEGRNASDGDLYFASLHRKAEIQEIFPELGQ